MTPTPRLPGAALLPLILSLMLTACGGGEDPVPWVADATDTTTTESDPTHNELVAEEDTSATSPAVPSEASTESAPQPPTDSASGDTTDAPTDVPAQALPDETTTPAASDASEPPPDEAAEVGVEDPNGGSADAPAGESTEEPADTPADEPVENPVETPVSEVLVTVNDASVVEGHGDLVFAVSVAEASTAAITLTYATQPVSATAGSDFTGLTGQLVLAPGETQRVITVTVLDDINAENTEHLELVLSAPSNATLSDASALGTILDDDALESLASFDPDWGSVGVFSAASGCGRCHRASAPGELDGDGDPVMRHPDANGADISPSRTWRLGMMAHAFDDPYFQAKMQDETNVLPQLAGVIEDKCLTCHAPLGRTHAHQTNTGLDAEGHYRYVQASTEMHAREGVSCTLCHQIQDDGNLGNSFSGSYSIGSDPDDKTIFGPFANPFVQPMLNLSGYSPEHATHITDSAHCATCHNLYTPTVDVTSGQIVPKEDGFLEQAPYFEWLNSIYSDPASGQTRHCQDCHMAAPQENYATRIAVRPSGTINNVWPQRQPYATHRFEGSNAYMLEVMQAYADTLGVAPATADEVNEQVENIRDFLRAKAASIAINRATAHDGRLEVDVTITNNSGHKLPTGFPSRRMWLHLRVTDGANRVVFESGQPNSSGRLSIDDAQLAPTCLAVEKPADFGNATCFEPHRDIISAPTQVAVYESVMADTNGHITHVLLHADRYLKDNRIPPRGFTRTRADTIEAQTLPVGVNADPDFNSVGDEGSGSDTVHYGVTLGGSTGPYHVQAQLLFQTVRPSFVASMHSDAGRVNRFKVMYANMPPAVELLDAASQAVNE